MAESVKEKAGRELVRFTVVNLVDKTVDGQNLLDMEFNYRPIGAAAGEVPRKYRILLNGKVNEAPREVMEHLKSREYLKYRQHKDEQTGDVYMVVDRMEPRFMVSEVK